MLLHCCLLHVQIGDFIDFFIEAVEAWGPAGYIAYGLVYTGLEVLAVPAIPLTMTAGVIFGTIPGTLLVSLSGYVKVTNALAIHCACCCLLC